MKYAFCVRIYLGFVWVVNGGLKLADRTFTRPGGQCEKWLREFTTGTVGPYHDFVMYIVIPHITLFASLVEWGETLVGVALIAGIFTRFAAWSSIFLATNYWVMRGAYRSIGGFVDIEPDLMVLAAVVLMWPATRVFAVDAVFNRRSRDYGNVSRNFI